MEVLLSREWLEADGLGGFASGTAAGIRTRRYHALLLTATTPPTGRVVLVNGFDAWVDDARRPLRDLLAGLRPGRDVSRRRFADRGVHASSRGRAGRSAPGRDAGRAGDPGARRTPRRRRCPGSCSSGSRTRDARGAAVSLRPRLLTPFTTRTRPFDSTPSRRPDGRLRFRPYAGLPAIAMRTNGAYAHDPDWYRNFLYAEERARGLDFLEDLASPGTFRFDLSSGEAVWLMAAEGHESALGDRRRRSRARGASKRRAVAARRVSGTARARGRRLPRPPRRGADDRRRLSVVHRLGPRHVHRAARALPRDRAGSTRRARFWSSGRARCPRGCCPNFFPDGKVTPEFNSVDASLWYVDRRARVLRGARGGGPARRGLRTARSCSGRRRDPRPATPAARATASAPTRTACSPPASRACSSPGWTRRSATGS